jgi:ABC-2 type transport system ATP-binding protein
MHVIEEQAAVGSDGGTEGAGDTGPALAIEATGLVKTYGKDVRALDGLGFAVEAGTVFALVGPKGEG